MSVLEVMERLKVEAVKEANALNPTRKGVYIDVKQDSVSALYAKMKGCLIEGDEVSAYAFALELSKRSGKTLIYSELLDICFTHANSLFLNISNRATYLCANEQHRRPIKSHEVCLMYVINMLCKTVRTDDAIQRYKIASHSFDQTIKHARDTYWNNSTRALQKIAEDKRIPIPQRIIALQYLYGVEIEEAIGGAYNRLFKPYKGEPELWFSTSLALAGDNIQLQLLIQLGYMYYKKAPMVGLALTLKKPVDKNG